MPGSNQQVFVQMMSSLWAFQLQSPVLCCVQTLLGEGAQVVLEGQRVLPAKTQEQGFNFKYDDVDAAVREIVST